MPGDGIEAMEDRFEVFAELEDEFDGRSTGGKRVSRGKSARQLVEIKPVAVEPRCDPEPLTDEEAHQILEDWRLREEQGKSENICGLE